jgi:hypothetical protein
MSDLQTAYYIIAIVFMGLMLLLGLVIALAVIVIRSKIVGIHKQVEAKIGQVSQWAETGTSVISALKKVSTKRGK